MGIKTKKLNKDEVQSRINRWWIEGLVFGVIMFFLNEVIIKLIFFDEEIVVKNLLLAIPIWLIGGLGYGFYMKWFLTRKLKKMSQEH